MSIKCKISLLGLCASLLVVSAPPAVKAQTNVIGASSFVEQVTGYFTSFNTNLDDCFRDTRASLWTGVSSIQGADVPLVNDLGVSYDLWRPSPATNSSSGTWTAISAESITRSSGVAGTFVSQQAGFGFSVVVHDARLTLFADAGYDLQAKRDRFYGEAGLRAFKALGHRAFAGASLGVQFPRNAQVFGAFVGFTF